MLRRSYAAVCAAVVLTGVLAAAALSLADSMPKSVSAGNAQRGLNNLLTRPYGGPMLTLAEYDKLWTVWEPEWKSKVDPNDPLSARKIALERYGFAPAPTEDGKSLLPVQFIRTDNQMTPTCMLCHAGRMPGNGKLVIGMPNTEVDMATFLDDLYKVRGNGASGAFFGATRGRTNATFFSHALLMRRNEDLSLRKTLAPLGLPTFLDEDAPAWWNMRPKHSLYIDGLVGGDFHRMIMQFAMQGEPGPEGQAIRAWEPDFVDILAYIESIQPPKYPWPIDHAQATAGEKVFDRTCAGCHGTYGKNGYYPDRVIPIDVVGTDPTRVKGVTQEFRRYLGKSWFGQLSTGRDVPEGYIAPPLNGIWATAPYFHNGSVPTLYGVLTESARPKYFRRTGDYRAYDTKNVGWEVEALNGPPASDLPAEARRRVIDTTKRSMSKGGHPFGFKLSEIEKHQVIEYLKTL